MLAEVELVQIGVVQQLLVLAVQAVAVMLITKQLVQQELSTLVQAVVVALTIVLLHHKAAVQAVKV